MRISKFNIEVFTLKYNYTDSLHYLKFLPLNLPFYLKQFFPLDLFQLSFKLNLHSVNSYLIKFLFSWYVSIISLWSDCEMRLSSTSIVIRYHYFKIRFAYLLVNGCIRNKTNTSVSSHIF